MNNPDLHAALLAWLTAHSGDARPEPERFAPLPVPGPRAATAGPAGPVIPAPRIPEAEPELTLF